MSKLLDPDEIPEWIAALCSKAKMPVIAGVNEDDCAILRWPSGILVATTDFFNANPMAIEAGIGGMWDLGRLLVAANLSDLCGSGARPVALLVGVTWPYGSSQTDFKSFMKGVAFEAKRHRVPIVGGDTKLGKSRAIYAVAIGSAALRKQLYLKNGARPGDLVWASGDMGSAAAAAWGYQKNKLNRRWKMWAKTALLSPRLPLKKAVNVSRAGLGRGGTDVSDGLGTDLLEICHASKVGMLIDEKMIPINRHVKEAASIAGVAPQAFAFASGGDFQFIVTTAKSSRERMVKYGFHEIGIVMREQKTRLKTASGKLKPIQPEGHRDRRRQPFSKEIDMLIQKY